MFLKKVHCYKPWTDFGVWDIEGNVRACCWSKPVLGNINQNSIEEVWNGEKYQTLRRKMASGIFECNSQCPVLHGKGFIGAYFTDPFGKDNDGKKTSPKCRENAKLNRREILQKKTVLRSKPRFFKIHVDNKCNLRCPMCQVDKKNPVTVSDSFLKELQTYYPFMEGLGIWGGEPLFSAKARQILFNFDYQKFPSCKISLVTNGTLINQYAKNLAKVNFDWIHISLDAATPKTYQKLRRGGNWKEVLAGIKKLVELRSRQSWFSVTIDMVLQPQNYTEIVQFINLAHGLGVKAAFDNLNTNPDWFSSKPKLKRQVKEQIRQGLKTAVRHDMLSAGIDLSILLDLAS